jgi:hypothetical protein
MAEFDKAISRTPVAIRDLSVVLVDYVEADEENPARQEARFEVQVEYDTGEIIVRQGNLVPHITTAQINALKAFLTSLRAQAVTQILP